MNLLLKINDHRGSINDIAIDKTGNFMVTTGIDCTVKIWDIRMLKNIRVYNTKFGAGVLDISHRDLLAIGHDYSVEIWKDYVNQQIEEPYMIHNMPVQQKNRFSKKCPVSSVAFCPFEDILGIGHLYGFSSIIVPGAGEPNFDGRAANPYQTLTQRREKTVSGLLDKIPPEMIVLNPDEIGTVINNPEEKELEREKEIFEINFPGKNWSPKHKARGRSAPTIVTAKKQSSVMERKREEFEKERIQREEEEKIRKQKEKELPPEPVNALERFKKK